MRNFRSRMAKINSFGPKFDMQTLDVDVKEIIERLDLEYVEENNELWINCPFHHEDEPSWSICTDYESEYYGIYSCFGCDRTGNIFTLIKHILKLTSLMDVKEWIEDNETVRKVITSSEAIKMLTKKDKEEHVEIDLPTTFELFTEDHLLNGSEDDIYLKYIKRRIKDNNIILENGIGYCDDGYYEGRIIIPVHNESGVLCTFEARHVLSKIDWLNYGFKTKYKKVLYPKYTRTKNLLFPIQQLNFEHNTVIIVEGLMDYFSMVHFGFQNVLSNFGNKFTLQKTMDISKFKRIIACPDGDKGGIRLLQDMRRYVDGERLRWMKLPSGKDPGNCSREEMRESFKHLYK